jgi:hypothetical protein
MEQQQQPPSLQHDELTIPLTMMHIFDDDHSSTQQQVLPQQELPATIVQKPNPRLEKCILFLADLCCKPQTRSQFT